MQRLHSSRKAAKEESQILDFRAEHVSVPEQRDLEVMRGSGSEPQDILLTSSVVFSADKLTLRSYGTA